VGLLDAGDHTVEIFGKNPRFVVNEALLPLPGFHALPLGGIDQLQQRWLISLAIIPPMRITRNIASPTRWQAGSEPDRWSAPGYFRNGRAD